MAPEAFENLRSGNYTINAWVRNWGGVEVQVTDWKFVIESSLKIEFVEPDEVETIEDRDETRFEVKAYDMRVGEENGEGIDRVEFKIIEQNLPADEDTVIFEDEYDREDDGDPRAGAFCVFDPASDSDECDRMEADLYDELTTGEYLIRVKVIRELEGGEEEWEEDELVFEIPDMPITVSFVDSTLTQSEPMTITDRSETAFRARAFRAREGVEDTGTEPTDGQGISNVTFTIRDPEGNKVIETKEEGAPFCAFGNTDGTCNEMPSDQYSNLSAGEYTIEAKATAFNEDTKTSATVRFIIPPPDITLTFWYPDPLADLSSNRVTKNLLALYTFTEGIGNVVRDVSGFGTPLDLTIEDPSKVQWLPGRGLAVNQNATTSDPRNTSTIIKSAAAASKITNAVSGSSGTEQLTIEAWIRPTDTGRDGPARIVTLSDDTGNNRSFTLGQGLWSGQPTDVYDVRLDTTKNAGGLNPSVVTQRGKVTTDLTHVVYTINKNGVARIYLNGVLVKVTAINGNAIPGETGSDRNKWKNKVDITSGSDRVRGAWGDYHFALGNELTYKTDDPSTSRFWKGEYYLVAIYSRMLTSKEVKQNFNVMVEAAEGGVLEISDISQTAFEIGAFRDDIPESDNGEGIGKVQFELSGPGVSSLR
ncbi:MAG: LamG domain-containing protein [Chloroflexaceae bacterium]|nr:LamG domain-containing protein [Chloroflexaceae bacterium]